MQPSRLAPPPPAFLRLAVTHQEFPEPEHRLRDGHVLGEGGQVGARLIGREGMLAVGAAQDPVADGAHVRRLRLGGELGRARRQLPGRAIHLPEALVGARRFRGPDDAAGLVDPDGLRNPFGAIS